MKHNHNHPFQGNHFELMSSLFKFLGFISILLFLFSSFFHEESFSLIVTFVENFISPDHHLEVGAIPILEGYFFFLKKLNG